MRFSNPITVKKREVGLWAKQVAPGTEVYNYLEDITYVASRERCICISGVLGELWLITEKEYQKRYGYHMPTVHEWLGILDASEATYTAQRTKDKGTIELSDGSVAHVNRFGVPHFEGDWLVSDGKESWVVNGFVFDLTYQPVDAVNNDAPVWLMYLAPKPEEGPVTHEELEGAYVMNRHNVYVHKVPLGFEYQDVLSGSKEKRKACRTGYLMVEPMGCVTEVSCLKQFDALYHSRHPEINCLSEVRTSDGWVEFHATNPEITLRHVQRLNGQDAEINKVGIPHADGDILLRDGTRMNGLRFKTMYHKYSQDVDAYAYETETVKPLDLELNDEETKNL